MKLEKNRRIVAAAKNKINTENIGKIIKTIKSLKKRGDFKGFFQKILKIKQKNKKTFLNLIFKNGYGLFYHTRKAFLEGNRCFLK